MSWLARILGRRPEQRPAVSTPEMDHRTLLELARAGANLSKPTEVISYLYLPDEPRAQAAREELAAAGYDVTVRPAATGSNWLALAKIEMVPSRENIGLLRQRFEGLAVRLEGDYDGWEAAVTS